MKKRISDFLVVTDIDQTLLNSAHEVPERNLEAISRFRAKGGRFTIATGRGIESARRLARLLDLDTPAIVSNGSVIYDYTADAILAEETLPGEIKDLTYRLLARFPNVGAEAFSKNDTYVLQYNRQIHDHIALERFTYTEALDGKQPTGGWTKALFAGTPEEIARMNEYVQSLDGVQAEFVMSAPVYLEILPKGVNKGTGLMQLARILGVDAQCTVAVGDYYNDEAMIRMAGIGAMVENAPAELKEKADLLVGHCDSGAVADLIEHLEALCAS